MSSIEDRVRAFYSKYPKRTCPKGQIILFANEKPEHIYYIQKGKVVVYSISTSGDEIILNIFKPPAFFPMNWAINKSENSYFYKAEIETVVNLIPPEDALRFIKDNPDIMLDLLSRLYRGVDGLLMRVETLMSGSAKTRLIYELLLESRRFGKTEANGKVTLSINEVDLAARTGLSRETVSREMHKLKQNDVVRRNGKNIVINELYEIQNMLGD